MKGGGISAIGRRKSSVARVILRPGTPDVADGVVPAARVAKPN
jgi:ribosomal protein S9